MLSLGTDGLCIDTLGKSESFTLYTNAWLVLDFSLYLFTITLIYQHNSGATQAKLCQAFAMYHMQ